MMGMPSTQPLPPLLEMLAAETRLPRFEDLLTSASAPRKPPTSSLSADSPIRQDELSASGRSTDVRETTLPLQILKNATPSSESNSISGESSFARVISGESNRVDLLNAYCSGGIHALLFLRQNSLRLPGGNSIWPPPHARNRVVFINMAFHRKHGAIPKLQTQGFHLRFFIFHSHTASRSAT